MKRLRRSSRGLVCASPCRDSRSRESHVRSAGAIQTYLRFLCWSQSPRPLRTFPPPRLRFPVFRPVSSRRRQSVPLFTQAADSGTLDALVRRWTTSHICLHSKKTSKSLVVLPRVLFIRRLRGGLCGRNHGPCDPRSSIDEQGLEIPEPLLHVFHGDAIFPVVP